MVAISYKTNEISEGAVLIQNMLLFRVLAISGLVLGFVCLVNDSAVSNI
jgi:hypothetical protein